MKGYNRCMALKIPVIVTLSARSGLCFAAPVHVYDRAGLPFYHRREAQHRASMSHLVAAVKTPAAVVADFAMLRTETVASCPVTRFLQLTRAPRASHTGTSSMRTAALPRCEVTRRPSASSSSGQHLAQRLLPRKDTAQGGTGRNNLSACRAVKSCHHRW